MITKKVIRQIVCVLLLFFLFLLGNFCNALVAFLVLHKLNECAGFTSG